MSNAMNLTSPSDNSLHRFQRTLLKLVAEHIWLLIIEVINVFAEALNFNTMILTKQAISNDKQIKTAKVAFDKLQS